MANRNGTKGTSLAKGPVGLIGLALAAYGVTALIFGGHSFAQPAPNGAVHGKSWLGLEVNGWSGLLFVAGGLLLLLAAPLHWGAKGMSLIVGLALGTAALIALANGHGTLGIFAANHLTELVWGAVAVLLIVLSQLPRVGAKTQAYTGNVGQRSARQQVERQPPPRAGEAADAGPTARSSLPSAARESAVPVEREPVAANGARAEAHVAPARARSAGAATAPRPRKRQDLEPRPAAGLGAASGINNTNAPTNQEGSAWLTSTSMKAKAASSKQQAA